MKIFIWLGRFTIFAACGFISAFLLFSGYESFAAQSLPFVHTIDPVELMAISDSYDLGASQTKEAYGSYGKPVSIKISGRSAQLPITSPIESGGQWLARTNTFHMFTTSPPRGGALGAAVVYCRSSFRTIDDRTLPEPSSNIFIDTDNQWRYVYRVASAKLLPADSKYVPADSGAHGHLLILCQKESENSDFIIEASLISVQGIE